MIYRSVGEDSDGWGYIMYGAAKWHVSGLGKLVRLIRVIAQTVHHVVSVDELILISMESGSDAA